MYRLKAKVKEGVTALQFLKHFNLTIMKTFKLKHHRLNIFDNVKATSYTEASMMVGVGFRLFTITK